MNKLLVSLTAGLLAFSMNISAIGATDTAKADSKAMKAQAEGDYKAAKAKNAADYKTAKAEGCQSKER